jgi:excisionase family DNA binding protein
MMKTERHPTQLLREYYDLNGASEYSTLSTTTLRRAIAAGRLVALRPAGRLVISRKALDAYLHGQEPISSAEPGVQ